nr:rhamnogalacturonan acetylesterase [Neobacillus sp. Marseille-Q6967]
MGTNVRSSTSAERNKTPITIYLAGDSTVSNYPRKYKPRTGWGEVLGERFDGDIVIKNAASPGRSSKSFIQEGRLRLILNQIQPGDYLFIQFGHNDEKKHKPALYTEPSTTYKSYLKQYIEGARKKRAIPVLVTPVERWRFSQKGNLQSSHGHYPEAMKELGKEEKVPVIDLTSMSSSLFQELGPEKTKEFFLWLNEGEHPNYPNGVKDGTHFQESGAKEIARLVAEGVRELHLPLSRHLK